MAQCLFVCAHLVGQGRLQSAVVAALKLILPPAVAAEWVGKISAGLIRLPSKSALSKFQAKLDSAFMRAIAIMRESVPVVQFYQVDSSPQRGRDYELLLRCSIKCDDLPEVFRRTSDLFAMRAWARNDDGTPSDPDEAHGEVQAVRRINELLLYHKCVPVVIGAGRSSRAHKLHAICHALHLESVDWHAVARDLSADNIWTTDLGTEATITSVEPFQVVQLFPWVVGDEHVAEPVGPFAEPVEPFAEPFAFRDNMIGYDLSSSRGVRFGFRSGPLGRKCHGRLWQVIPYWGCTPFDTQRREQPQPSNVRFC
jgi:hypothetical protein